jgi:hypothetical protein
MPGRFDQCGAYCQPAAGQVEVACLQGSSTSNATARRVGHPTLFPNSGLLASSGRTARTYGRPVTRKLAGVMCDVCGG